MPVLVKAFFMEINFPCYNHFAGAYHFYRAVQEIKRHYRHKNNTEDKRANGFRLRKRVHNTLKKTVHERYYYYCKANACRHRRIPCNVQGDFCIVPQNNVADFFYSLSENYFSNRD